MFNIGMYDTITSSGKQDPESINTNNVPMFNVNSINHDSHSSRCV